MVPGGSATKSQVVYVYAKSVGAAVVGDALLGSFLVVADAGGGVRCLCAALSSSELLLRKPSESAASSPPAVADAGADVVSFGLCAWHHLLRTSSFTLMDVSSPCLLSACDRLKSYIMRRANPLCPELWSIDSAHYSKPGTSGSLSSIQCWQFSGFAPISFRSLCEQEVTVAERFEQLLGGPKQVELPAAPGVRCGTLEGRRLLNASITALRESHIEFVHSAYHELLQVDGLLSW